MNYKINFNNYKNNFSLPTLIVENNLKDINSDYLKIILMIFKNPDKNYSVNLLSNLLNLSESTVKGAIQYWIGKGVLLNSKEMEVQIHMISEKPIPDPAKPVVDSELKFLLSSMEGLLQRPVTSTDVKTITYIYEYYRLPADVILMAIQYSVEKGKNAIKYIETICINWYDKGINSHTLAEEYLKLASEQTDHENQVKKMFGIAGRKLIPSEEKFIASWFTEYCFDIDMIQLAYEKTIKNTGKVAFAYTNKILSNWYKKGYKTLKEVLENEGTTGGKNNGGSSGSSYDIDMLDKYWDKVPTLE